MTGAQLRTFRAAVKAYRAHGPVAGRLALLACYDAFGITDECCQRYGDAWCHEATKPIAYAVLDAAKGVKTPRHIRRGIAA
jgi:hypothetical protein